MKSYISVKSAGKKGRLVQKMFAMEVEYIRKWDFFLFMLLWALLVIDFSAESG
jgi:hypothetical protein